MPVAGVKCLWSMRNGIGRGDAASVSTKRQHGHRSMLPLTRLNLSLPTLGGRQLWADLRHFRGWRIQRNVLTGHCRLLDPRSVRRAWGSFEACAERLERFKADLKLPPIEREVVVVLHGLARSRTAMATLARYLATDTEFDVCNVSYPSTRIPIADHAANLAGIVASLAPCPRVHFVGHSLGNIVVRHMLADRARAEADGQSQRGPEIGRVVMLAPPNRGAALAVRLQTLGLLHVVLGRSLAELGRDWSQLEARLETPREFGIIAATRGHARGYNPLLPGDDDLIVALEETRLDGAADFLEIPSLHAFIMSNPAALRQTLHFFRNGRFAAE
jgi:pimeloyl-ACP methyl ester carboxylesterase